MCCKVVWFFYSVIFLSLSLFRNTIVSCYSEFMRLFYLLIMNPYLVPSVCPGLLRGCVIILLGVLRLADGLYLAADINSGMNCF